MSFLAKLKYAAPAVHHRYGLSGYLIGKGEKYAGAALFGYLKGYYREKTLVNGVPVDLLAGVALTAGSVLSQAMSGGRSKYACHMDSLGDAGLMSYFNSLGAVYGTKKSGRQVVVGPSTAKAPPGFNPTTVMGSLPQAVGGAFLTPDEVAAYSKKR